MRRLTVRLKERSYKILIGHDLMPRAGRFIRDTRIAQKNLLIVSQKPVAALYLRTLEESLLREGFRVSTFITQAARNSEEDKSQRVWARLIQKIASVDGQNHSVALVALGGGVIGDLTGFAASVYRRGIPYIQIPTTLTAQVDSAIGGKTAIDLPQGKNLLGSIYQPKLVLSDLGTLDSLSSRSWSDGLAEVIKYGVIKDTKLFTALEKQNKDSLRQNRRFLEEVIFRCAKTKAEIITKDEKDTRGIRMILNFGHTGGHAIEAACGYSRQYTHGEGVALGMLLACEIAKKTQVLKDPGLFERLEKTILKYELPLFYKGLATGAVLKAMGYDKKAIAGSNRFVLPAALGKMTIVRDIPQALIEECLALRKA